MKFTSILLLINTIACAQIVTIPDNNFKNYLVINPMINTNSDTEIQISEANAFTGTINCSNLSITSLSGIEAFINLSKLNFMNNYVSSVNLSFNTSLTHLHCDINQLTELGLSSNLSLDILTCYDNNISSLDLSNNLNLSQLECSSNNIDTLDLSAQSNLIKIVCNSNNLHYVNVANGNNMSIPSSFIGFLWNPYLTCVQVDDTTYSNQNWSHSIQYNTIFSLDCNSLVSVNELDLSQSVTLYPNPAQSQIHINTDLNIQSVQIIDAFGKMSSATLTSNNTLNTSNLSNGIYFLQVFTTDGLVSKKFIKG